MPNKASAEKRMRKTERQTLRNRIWKSKVHTLTKRVIAEIDAGDKDKAESEYRVYESAIDKAAGKGVIHARNAARHKARMRLKINSISN